MKGRIVVYSILGCPHCLSAKSRLQKLSLEYVDVILDYFPPEVRQELARRTGRRTVPQIFFNARHIGGNQELIALTVGGGTEWEELIREVRENQPGSDAPVVPDPASAIDSAAAELGFVCELDEYAQLVHELKRSGIIRDHRKGLSMEKSSFTGKEFIDWITKRDTIDRDHGAEIGLELIRRNFGHSTSGSAGSDSFQDDSTRYRLLEDDRTRALNASTTSDCRPRPAVEVAEGLRRTILRLYNAHLQRDGRAVDYAALGKDSGFAEYVAATTELQRIDLANLSRNEKLAFFINIYNALVIHAIVVRGPATNLWQRYRFFNSVSYIIGGNVYSLQDIENGVLRANRKGVGMLRNPFGKSDSRLSVALDTAEPLVHFALVCGAKSCPPIKTYSAGGVMEELKTACQAFLEGDDGCLIVKGSVRLSKIFSWYRVDFGANLREVVYWVYQHIGEGQKQEELKEILAGGTVNVEFMKYDWGVNSKH